MTKYYILYETDETIGALPIGHNDWDNVSEGVSLFRAKLNVSVSDIVAITDQYNLERLVKYLKKDSPEKEFHEFQDYL